MTEAVKQRLVADIDKVLNNLPDDLWSKKQFAPLVKQFKSLVLGKRKQMATWLQMQVIDSIAKLYGMEAVWNERTKLCYVHVSDVPSVYSDAEQNCAITYYGMFSASQSFNNIYDCMQQVKDIFLVKYDKNQDFAEAISRLNQITILLDL